MCKGVTTNTPGTNTPGSAVPPIPIGNVGSAGAKEKIRSAIVDGQITPRPGATQCVSKPSDGHEGIRPAPLGLTNKLATLQERVFDGGETQGDWISGDLTEEEKGRLEHLIESVKENRAAASSKEAINKLAKCAIDASLGSRSQQIYQLTTLYRVLDFLDQYELTNAEASGKRKKKGAAKVPSSVMDIKLKTLKNKYSHYITEIGKGKGTTRKAVDEVLRRVQADLDDNKNPQEIRLKPDTCRDVAALITLLGSTFKKLTEIEVQYRNLLKASGLAVATEKPQDNEHRATTVTGVGAPIDPKNPAELEEVDVQIGVEKINPWIGVEEVDPRMKDLKEKRDEIFREFFKSGRIGGKLKREFASLMEKIPENKNEEKLYPKSGDSDWDKHRQGAPVKTARGILQKIPNITKIINMESDYPKVDTDGDLARLRYHVSTFGPSLTVWHTVRFMDAVLGATKEEQKVYATAQASDWAEHAHRRGKYSGIFRGAHTPYEALMTFSHAIGDEKEDSRTKETLMRLILEMNITAEGGKLTAHPKRVEDGSTPDAGPDAGLVVTTVEEKPAPQDPDAGSGMTAAQE